MVDPSHAISPLSCRHDGVSKPSRRTGATARRQVDDKVILGKALPVGEAWHPGYQLASRIGEGLAGPAVPIGGVARWTGRSWMGIEVFTRIPCVVQVGHDYSGPMAQYPDVIDIQIWWGKWTTAHFSIRRKRPVIVPWGSGVLPGAGLGNCSDFRSGSSGPTLAAIGAGGGGLFVRDKSHNYHILRGRGEQERPNNKPSGVPRIPAIFRERPIRSPPFQGPAR